MRAPLGPVQAGSSEDPPAGAQLVEINAQGDDQSLAVGGERVVAVVGAVQGPSREQPVSQLDAATPREVVIAGAGLSHDGRVAVLAQCAKRHLWRDLGERLEDRRDVRAGELVVAVASLHPNANKSALDQPAQVRGRGRRRHAGLPRQLAGRQRPAVSQRGEHRCAGRITEQSSCRRQVDSARCPVMLDRMTQARFDRQRNVTALLSRR